MHLFITQLQAMHGKRFLVNWHQQLSNTAHRAIAHFYIFETSLEANHS